MCQKVVLREHVWYRCLDSLWAVGNYSCIFGIHLSWWDYFSVRFWIRLWWAEIKGMERISPTDWVLSAGPKKSNCWQQLVFLEAPTLSYRSSFSTRHYIVICPPKCSIVKGFMLFDGIKSSGEISRHPFFNLDSSCSSSFLFPSHRRQSSSIIIAFMHFFSPPFDRRTVLLV